MVGNLFTICAYPGIASRTGDLGAFFVECSRRKKGRACWDRTVERIYGAELVKPRLVGFKLDRRQNFAGSLVVDDRIAASEGHSVHVLHRRLEVGL